VHGIGPRTAARLLAEFGCAADAFANLDRARAVLGGGIAQRLATDEARAVWELNCQVMTMRADVCLDLDLSAGRGVLPLPAHVVEQTFRAHNLIWSARDAVRVLAEVEPEALAAETVQVAEPGWWASYAPPRRLPPLPPRRPAAKQLSLFD
jgi:5'-3' exonuclease